MVLQGPDKGRRFELPDAPALVGRESRQLPLSDNTVSRRHAELVPGDDGWVLRALGSSFDTEQVLEVVMDLVFEHVKADRGIILLVDEKNNEVVPKVVRTREEQEAKKNDDLSKDDTGTPIRIDGQPEETKIHASRTIINHVINAGEGVLSSNAMTDKRFSSGKSVHAMSIRSALCV